MTRAAVRDASFYRRPNVRSVKLYHVVAGEEQSACGRLLLANISSSVDETIDAADAPLGLRCQRPGCKARWPAFRGSDAAQGGPR